ncbi:MAG: ABC transporter permease subunit [Candidatus Bruticola sp.]
MSRFFRWTAGTGAGLFIVLFIIIPMAVLLLTSFTGEPIPVLEYLVSGRLKEMQRELTDNFSLQYYAELFDTQRYTQGLINAVGLVPGLTAVIFTAAIGLHRLLGFIKPVWSEGLKRMLGTASATLVATLIAVFSFTWRFWLPEGAAIYKLMLWLAPGKTTEAILLQTFGFCSSVTAVASVLGLTAAFCLERVNMTGRGVFRILCIIPLALPSFLGALAVKNILGINGIAAKMLGSVGLELPFEAQSVWAAGLTQVFLYFPFVLLTVGAALKYSDNSLNEAAKIMGANSTFSFLTVGLPMLMPGLLSGAFLVFVRSFGDFSAISLLMPMKYPMIIVEAYRDLSGSTYWGGACMLSVLMVLSVLIWLYIQKYFLSSLNFEVLNGRSGAAAEVCCHPGLRWAAFIFCSGLFMVSASFIIVTFIVSIAGTWGIELMPTSYTLSRYAEVWKNTWSAHSPLANSFLLAVPGLFWSLLLASAAAVFIVGSRSKLGNLLDFSILLPFVVPGVVFAVALICTFNGPPLAWHLTAALVVCAYILTSMPYGVRSITASLSQLNPSIKESSLTLGAPPVLTLAKVIVPLIWPGIAAGGIMIFIACMQEVAVTLMTCPPKWRPVSTYIFMEIQEGNIFNASAYGIVLFVLIMLPYSWQVLLSMKTEKTVN